MQRSSLHLPAIPALGTALLVSVALLALSAGAASAGSAAHRAKPTGARLTLTRLKVSGQKLTIGGRVSLPAGAASRRRRAKVAFTLKDARRHVERFSTGLDRRSSFKLTRATKLQGRISLAARVTIAGKASGRALSRVLTVRAPSTTRRSSSSPGGGTATGGGGGSAAPGAPVAPQGTPLVGTFHIDAGVSQVSGIVGSWFQMLAPTGTPFVNADSRAGDKTYTLLDPGTDGGLRTDAYQPPPTPAFTNGGAALANEIIQPTEFFGQYFSIVSASVDPQLGVADPLPQIYADGGRLSGQVTAWAAQWNGNSFNQGTPKPDGSTPGMTTPLTGTYDAASRRYVLNWKSLIVTGPFNGFTGSWHLTGTFTPAGA